MTKRVPEHVPMTQFRVEDDCLVVGGIKLTHLAQRVGTTPFYAYDRGLLSQRLQMLREQLSGEIRIHYAMKANPMLSLIHI